MNSYYLEIGKQLYQRELEKTKMLGTILSSSLSTLDFDAYEPVMSKPFEVLTHENMMEKSSPTEKILDQELPRSLTSFSGCDMVISLDGDLCGEVQGIYFFKSHTLAAASLRLHSDYIDRHLIEDYPVVVVIDTALFNKSLAIKDGTNITMTYANEYGQKAMRSIFDAHVLYSFNGASVDDILFNEVFVLCAKDVTAMEVPKEGPIDEDRTTEGPLE